MVGVGGVQVSERTEFTHDQLADEGALALFSADQIQPFEDVEFRHQHGVAGEAVLFAKFLRTGYPVARSKPSVANLDLQVVGERGRLLSWRFSSRRRLSVVSRRRGLAIAWEASQEGGGLDNVG